jgi:hypothetical protein
MIFEDIFDRVLQAFIATHVDFMIVGGFAVNYHGYSRNTSDLDIWVKSDPVNQANICMALRRLNYNEEAIAMVANLDFSKHFLFHIGDKPFDVEVFNFITGVSYETASKNKVAFKYGEGLFVNFISLNDLLVNKMLSGRNKDKIDVEELQKIEKLK